MLTRQFFCCSRNSENNTGKYPDLAADVPKLLKPGVTSVVLDCEAVAYDRVTKKILPFQVSPLHNCLSVFAIQCCKLM